jgi:N-acetylmuramoyl-L-alanine amidase
LSSSSSLSVLPLVPGVRGPAVQDLQHRLSRLGFVPVDPEDVFGPLTEAAVRRFQDARGLRSDGQCAEQTWNALVEAGFSLGDRLLYERRPMLRGDDVAELQSRLGRLGFHDSRADGIFGPETAVALVDFQRNAGCTSDGICGPDTLAALDRLGRRTDHTTKVGVRETEALLRAPRLLAGRTVFLGEHGGLAVVVANLERALQDEGALVIVSHHPSESIQASEANEAKADVFLGVATSSDPGCVNAYYSTATFESAGGHGLAHRLAEELAPVLHPDPAVARGMRIPVLRETRMPAIVCEIGPPERLVAASSTIAAAVRQAMSRWVAAPLDA